jgi:hypothetical protein
MAFRHRLHDTTGDDLGLIEHPPKRRAGGRLRRLDGGWMGRPCGEGSLSRRIACGGYHDRRRHCNVRTPRVIFRRQRRHAG